MGGDRGPKGGRRWALVRTCLVAASVLGACNLNPRPEDPGVASSSPAPGGGGGMGGDGLFGTGAGGTSFIAPFGSGGAAAAADASAVVAPEKLKDGGASDAAPADAAPADALVEAH